MLQIKKISKKYKTGDLVQIALDEVSLNLRDNEFVSILGPSGSGKTTLLNIIGGLDRYDSGDLIINNVSTKKYKDRDWDSYRNHTIGFVFQSYNLIPHQSILANVELALTISGISKKERKRRALAALDEVGLKDQAHKKPSQMSGGQMQRVAIARALVNNPDILLADEPTGALDTETSIQVMDLLKRVAKDRLVVMVTHNPELAEEYSTRIVRLKDGKVISDTNPLLIDETKLEKPKHKNLGKSSMSRFTAFSLSFNNLLTKKARTILTAFAGSIGIIGIALILSLSTGFKNYIDKIQEDTLSSYPLTVTSETADATAALVTMVTDRMNEELEEGIVKERQYVATMFSKIGTNDLRSFKEYLEQENADELATIEYSYSVQPLIYKDDVQVSPSTLIENMMGGSSMGMSYSFFYELSDDWKDNMDDYDIVAGRLPESFDELLLVLPEKNGIPDTLVYGIGLRDMDELEEMIMKISQGETVTETNEPLLLTHEELLNLNYHLVDPSATYKYNSQYKLYEDMRDDKAFMERVINESLPLKVVGIVSAKEDAEIALMPGIAYQETLTDYVIEQAKNSSIVKAQLENDEIDVFTGKRFDDKTENEAMDFDELISIDQKLLEEAFGSNVSEEDMKKIMETYIQEISSVISVDTTEAEEMFFGAYEEILTSFFTNYFNTYKVDHDLDETTPEVATFTALELFTFFNEHLNSEEVKEILKDLEAEYVIPADQFKTIYEGILLGNLQAYLEANAGSITYEEAQIGPHVTSVLATLDYLASMMPEIQETLEMIPPMMQEAYMQKNILTDVAEMSGKIIEKMANAFNVDADKMAQAFKFEMDEDQMKRIFETMSTSGVQKTAKTNLISLGYQDVDDPTSISFTFKDFEAKENFMAFLDDYNEKMEKVDEEKVIQYTDITGILISSVKTIVDSVSYVLIAFVSISLVVSSIMIGIITYISVLERTKEIGILRAIGASKKNISSIFNAETFIVGFISGLLGIGVTLALIPPINSIIHNVTGNMDINAVMPTNAAIALVILSVILTSISGLIPSRQAAKKDPVLALRSE